jgi:hypothetical protein
VTSKTNPNRWYIVMVFCIMFSLFVFLVGPRLGYETQAVHDIALIIGMWAPTLGILGVRAELINRKL